MVRNVEVKMREELEKVESEGVVGKGMGIEHVARLAKAMRFDVAPVRITQDDVDALEPRRTRAVRAARSIVK